MSEFYDMYETASGVDSRKPPPTTIPPYFPQGTSVVGAQRMTMGGKEKSVADSPPATNGAPVANWSIFLRAERNGGGKYKKLYLNFHSLNPGEAKALAEALIKGGNDLMGQVNGGGKKNKVEIDISSVLTSNTGP